MPNDDRFERIESGGAIGAFGSAPYADRQEVTGPPEPVVILDTYRPFLATDARSVVVTLAPNHRNYIPNPSFRVDTSGWEVPAGSVLDPEDSWVGQSLVVGSGSHVLRYLDSDMNTDAAFVYVGPSEEDLHSNSTYFLSSQWRFSVYLKGRAKVVLTMNAYRPEEYGVYKSPPRNANAPEVADPLTAPFDAAVPSVVHSGTGRLWALKSGPYYRSLGRVAVADKDPTTYTDADYMPPYLQEASGELFANGAGGYTSLGIPPMSSDPASEDPATNGAAKFVRSNSGDMSLWRLKDSYEVHVPDEEGGVPPYHYYAPYTVPLVDDHTQVQPDLAGVAAYLQFGDLLYRATGSSTAPFYAQMGGTMVEAPVDPSAMPPDQDLVRFRDNVWVKIGAPYYEETDQRGRSFASVSSPQAVPISVEDDGEWHRVTVATEVISDFDGRGGSFGGVYWIDAKIRLEVDQGDEVRVSSVMLDSTESPVAHYFDGSMSQVANTASHEDYMWSGQPNSSVSWYFYDRRIRTEMLHQLLDHLTPAPSPYQIYYGNARHPYVPGVSFGQGSRSFSG